jgi:hypothetical protein
MTPHPAAPNTDEFVERIVREVIRRLMAMNAQVALSSSFAAAGNPLSNAPVVTTHTVTAKLITVATLEALPRGTTEALIPTRAVVTPLARDEAKLMGIRLTRVAAAESPAPSFSTYGAPR